MGALMCKLPENYASFESAMQRVPRSNVAIVIIS